MPIARPIVATACQHAPISCKPLCASGLRLPCMAGACWQAYRGGASGGGRTGRGQGGRFCRSVPATPHNFTSFYTGHYCNRTYSRPTQFFMFLSILSLQWCLTLPPTHTHLRAHLRPSTPTCAYTYLRCSMFLWHGLLPYGYCSLCYLCFLPIIVKTPHTEYGFLLALIL